MRFWPRADGIQEFSSSSKARCRAFREVVASADAAGSEGAEPSRVLEASHDRLPIESEVPEMFVGADRVVFASGQLGTRRPGRRRGGKNASALDTGARIQGNLSSVPRASIILKLMTDPNVPAAVRLRTAESVFDRRIKAIKLYV